jgi:hypothetical protein
MHFYAVVIALVSCMPHSARSEQPPPTTTRPACCRIQKVNPASCLTAVAADGAPGKIAQGRPAMMPDWEKDYEAGTERGECSLASARAPRHSGMKHCGLRYRIAEQFLRI